MTSTFSQTVRALSRDSVRVSMIVMAAGLSILAALIAWSLLADIAVVASSGDAQLEASSLARPIESPVAGRVVASRLRLGERVEKGAPLVELDSQALLLEIAEQEARVHALGPQVAAIRAELAKEEHGLAAAAQAARAARVEVEAHLSEARSAVRIAREERSRMAALKGDGVVPELDLLRAAGQVEQRSAQARSLRIRASKLDLDERTTVSDRGVRIERLRRDESELIGDLEVTRAHIERLRHQVEQTIVRAPATGTLSSVVELSAGTMIDAGLVVGSVLPDGGVRIVARFDPPVAIGRVRKGQRAWMRLDGFPWTQYGTLPARVSAIASDSHGGRLRVELELLGSPPRSIPIQHGLPGTVEVEVERVSPANLVLRAAGLLFVRTDGGMDR